MIALLIPSVAIDLSIAEKFLKLPISAIPAGPRKIEIILLEKTPKTKLKATDTAFSDMTLYNLLCRIGFKLQVSYDTGWISSGENVWWNILGNHRTRANY